jgi:hypothetical protein
MHPTRSTGLAPFERENGDAECDFLSPSLPLQACAPANPFLDRLPPDGSSGGDKHEVADRLESPIRRSSLAAPAVVGRPASVGWIAWRAEGLLGLPESVDTSAYLAFWRRLPRKSRRLVSGKQGFEWRRPKRGPRRVLQARFR